MRDAIGMAGNRLEVDAHIITGANTAIQNVVKVVHKAGLSVDDMVLQVLASAEAVVTEDEIERGVVVVDVGGGTSDIAVFARGSIVHTSVIPVGGNHVTADLAVGSALRPRDRGDRQAQLRSLPAAHAARRCGGDADADGL